MSNHCIFIGWNRPVIGREMAAVEMFNMFVGYLTKEQKSGNIDSFEPVMLSVHGGDLNGFMLVRGSQQKLDGLRASDTFLEMVTKCHYNVQGFGVINGFIGACLVDSETGLMMASEGGAKFDLEAAGAANNEVQLSVRRRS